MTAKVLDGYRRARENRLGKNDARRIRGERDKATSSTSGAGRRWPFELLQNAHDPGPREGRKHIDVRFCSQGATLTFQHNGCPFTLDDLAALLSGGSNKEYDDPETSGRYGTGFLVTHALSPIISLKGVVSSGESQERFQIELDRSGDEKSIIENALQAETSLSAAKQISELGDGWTAEFVYPSSQADVKESGIDVISQCAPYLFATCDKLGSLEIESDTGKGSAWRARDTKEWVSGGLDVFERRLERKIRPG